MCEKFKLCWRALKTGETGSGTDGFPRSEANRMAAKLNQENEGILFYWVERFFFGTR